MLSYIRSSFNNNAHVKHAEYVKKNNSSRQKIKKNVTDKEQTYGRRRTNMRYVELDGSLFLIGKERC